MYGIYWYILSMYLVRTVMYLVCTRRCLKPIKVEIQVELEFQVSLVQCSWRRRSQCMLRALGGVRSSANWDLLRIAFLSRISMIIAVT